MQCLWIQLKVNSQFGCSAGSVWHTAAFITDSVVFTGTIFTDQHRDTLDKLRNQAIRCLYASSLVPAPVTAKTICGVLKQLGAQDDCSVSANKPVTGYLVGNHTVMEHPVQKNWPHVGTMTRVGKGEFVINEKGKRFLDTSPLFSNLPKKVKLSS